MADQRTGLRTFLKSWRRPGSPSADAWRSEPIAGGTVTKGEIVDELEKAPGLENAPTSALRALLADARCVDPMPTPLFEYGERPRDAFYVVLAGTIEYTRPGSPPWRQAAKFTVGSHELIAGEDMDACVTVVDAAPRISLPPLPPPPLGLPLPPRPPLPRGAAPSVVRISGDTFRTVLARDVELQIAVLRNGTTQPGPELSASPRSSNVYVVTAGSKRVSALLGLPPSASDARLLTGLADLVAEALTDHMYDSVLVLHVVAPGAPRPPDAFDRHMWAREGEPLTPILMREAALMPGVGAEALAQLERAAPLGDAKVGGEAIRVPIGERALVIHHVHGHLGLPRAAVVERRWREIGAAGLDALVAAELGPPVDHDARIVLMDVAPEAEKLRACPYNVVHLVGAPDDTLEIQTRGDGLVVTPSAVLPVDPKTSVRGDTPWPVGAVRLRFSPSFSARLDDPARTEPVSLWTLGLPPAELTGVRLTLERWARAIVGRRVALALGGGGPYGFVHTPFIHQLVGLGVPIDLVSGSSMGAVIGAYFTAFGNVDLFEQHRFALLKRLLKLSFLGTGTEFQEVLDRDLKDRSLLDLEVPFFPVVTDARTGVEWSIRSGPLGRGARASGSMPPFFPTTFIEDRRFLDGGLVANVPSRVLRDEGGALIIASNPIQDVKRGARRDPLFTWQVDGPFFVLRVLDTMRLVPMLFGALGDNQSRDAHVVFRPTEAGTEGRLLGLRPIDLAGLVVADNARVPEFVRRWVDANAVVDQDAGTSLNLNRAANQAKDAWRKLLPNAPCRAWLDWNKGTVEIEDGYAIMFTTGSEQLDPSCLELLHEIGDMLAAPEVAHATLRVAAATVELAKRRAEQVRRKLATFGVDVHERVGMLAAEGREEVTLIDLTQRPQGELARLRRELDRVARAANAGRLRSMARKAGNDGDPDLARLLALEASALDCGVETDAVLRAVLLLRGRLSREIAGVEADGVVSGVCCLAWHPDPSVMLLALGDGYGRVRVVDTTTGHAVIAEPTHRQQQGDATTAVQSVAWSPDGRLVASTGDDGRILVHTLGAGANDAPKLHAEADAGTWLQCGVAFSPAGDRLLATCPPRPAAAGARRIAASACVGIWSLSAPTLTVSHVLEHEAIARCAAWDPDGEIVAVGDESGCLTLWSAKDGALLSRHRDGGRFASALAWLRDPGDPQRRRRLAVARETDATVYDVDGGGAPITLTGHTAALTTIAWSPTGDLLLTAAADHTARIWDARTGGMRMIVRWNAAPLAGAAWHPGADPIRRHFATWSEDGKAQIWGALTGELFAILSGDQAAIHAAAFAPDGVHFATGSADGSTCVSSPVEPVPWFGPFGVLSGRALAPVSTVAWGRRGLDEVVATAFDGAAIQWLPDAASSLGATLLAPAPRPAGDVPIGSPIASAALSADGQRVAVVQRPDRSPYIVDLADPKATKRLGPASAAELPEHPAWDFGYQIAWSADQRHVAVHYGRSAAIWDVVTGERLLVLVGPTEEPASIDDDCFRWIAWHPTDGHRFAVARWFAARAVELWTLGEKEPLRCGDEKTGFPWQVAWSPDGAHVAAAHHDGRARIYDAATGAVVHELVHERSVGVLAWRPDGSALATGDFAGIVYVWARRAPAAGQAEAYELASDRAPQPGDIGVLVWSPDGQRLLASDDSGIATIWRAAGVDGAARWRIEASIPGHRASIGAASFDPKGERVVTGSDDGTLRVNPVTFERLVEAVASHLGRTSLSEDEWREYMSWAGERRPTWPRP